MGREKTNKDDNRRFVWKMKVYRAKGKNKLEYSDWKFRKGMFKDFKSEELHEDSILNIKS